jgi:Cu(I)/Ag(I) efflux system periplasmic protein CusF
MTGSIRVAPFASAATGLTDAPVRKLDRAAGRTTLPHGEIRNLEMPAMTMVFGVRDAAWLDRLKRGDKVPPRSRARPWS